MTATHEARAPRTILDRAASSISENGIVPNHIPSTRPSKIHAADWALAIGIASQDNELGMWCFWAKWIGSARSFDRLSVELSKIADAKEKYRLPLGIVAARKYCYEDVSERQICRALKVCRKGTWPKLRKPFARLVESAYTAEAKFARKLYRTMY